MENKMGKMKQWVGDSVFEDFADPKKYDEYWRTANDRWIRISEMEFSHLENTVNYFSREGMKVDPARQNAFDKVMVRYLMEKAKIEEQIARTQYDIL
jgi:hypothetical protein